MSNSISDIKRGRRQFLRDSMALGAGTATIVMSSSAVAATTAALPDDSPTQPTGHKGYELTQHIVDYYKSAAS